jgi:hypothetical protein
VEPEGGEKLMFTSAIMNAFATIPDTTSEIVMTMIDAMINLLAWVVDENQERPVYFEKAFGMVVSRSWVS